MRKPANGQSIIYLREDVCCCKNCVVSDYDGCVKGVQWKACNIGVSPENDAIRQLKIAKFYHLENWNESQTSFAQRPPLVAIQSEEHGLLLGLLRAKPIQLEKALCLNQQEKHVKFRAKKGTWCIKIDLLKVPDGVELNSHTYAINASNDYKDVLVPVHECLF